MTLTTIKERAQEILLALNLLHVPGDVVEMRCLKTQKATLSGYYDNFQKLAEDAAYLSGKVPTVYCTLNPVAPRLLARAVNQYKPYAENTTADADILYRRWLPLDFDPVRPAGISSTDAEHETALARAREARVYLTGQGWPDPVLGDSGNGGHLLSRIDLPSNKGSQALIERVLKAVAQRFSDATVKVDTDVSNAARIWKVYGTLACKGDSTAERPHRYARLLEIPVEIKVVTREQLEAIAESVRETIPQRHSNSKGKSFDLPAFFARYEIKAEPSKPSKDGQKYILPECPLNPEHKRTAFVIHHANGGLSAGCLHDSCRTKLDWHKFRAIYEPQPDAPAFSEDAIALEFTQALGDDLKYTPSMGLWFRWIGTHYQPDESLCAFTEARTTCRTAAKTAAAEPDKARRLASSATVSSVERLARYDPRHTVHAEEWDTNLWLLNTVAGTVDLHTGQLRRHRREDLITKVIPVTPGGDCALWRKFQDRVTAGNVELQTYIQRFVGYCLTGSTREHALFFLYGLGGNGKGVFLTTITGLLGPYTRTAPIEMLLASRNERHPCDMAALRGARLVTAQEVEKGCRWAETKLKALTGGDKIAARRMRQDFFEYTPQFKLILAGNHRPGLRSVDEAIRRRFNLVPFTVTIPPAERDPELSEKLKPEFGGILQWAIDGCLAWQREGLNPPAVVRDATAAYFGEEDALGRWITERCVLDAQEKATSNALFTSWSEWAEKAGEFVGSQKSLGQSLEARDGICPCRTEKWRGYRGIRLKTYEELRQDEQLPAPTVKPNGRDVAQPPTPDVEVIFDEPTN